MKRYWLGFVCAAAMLTVGNIHAQGLTPDQTGRIDAAIQDVLAASQTPSASVAVVKDGTVVYTGAYGQAALSPGVAATPSTRYQIASVSKEFVAAGILLLQEDGKLSLDDKVSKWYPDLTSADTITLRQILTHTSGYSDFWPQDYVMNAIAVDTTPDAILKTYAGAPLDYAPGTDWQYSNTGYVLAGRIIEKVSGQSLFDFIRTRILKPVGISDAEDMGSGALAAPDALGYQRVALGGNRPVPTAGTGWLYGDAFLALTAEDVAKWDISYLRKSLLRPDSYTQEIQTQKLANGNDTGYAMGLFVSKPGGRTLIEHTGEGAGYLSENRIYPDDGVAVVVLTNTMSGRAFLDIADRVTYVMLPPSGADKTMLDVFESLQAGKPDMSQFTPDMQGYLTPENVADFAATLGPLGAPSTFRPTGSFDRGGMTYRGYRITAGGRTLSLSTYMTKDGRIEQYLVSPVN